MLGLTMTDQPAGTGTRPGATILSTEQRRDNPLPSHVATDVRFQSHVDQDEPSFSPPPIRRVDHKRQWLTSAIIRGEIRQPTQLQISYRRLSTGDRAHQTGAPVAETTRGGRPFERNGEKREACSYGEALVLGSSPPTGNWARLKQPVPAQVPLDPSKGRSATDPAEGRDRNQRCPALLSNRACDRQKQPAQWAQASDRDFQSRTIRIVPKMSPQVPTASEQPG